MAEQEDQEVEERTPRLQLFSSPHSMRMQQQEQKHLLQSSSPLHTSAASVPFRWEQHPGKPIHDNDDLDDVHLLDFEPKKKSLDLPPRMLVMEEADRSKLQSSSFRVMKRDWQLGTPSFRRTESSLDGRRGVFSSLKVLFKGGHNDVSSNNGGGGREVGGSYSSYVFPAYLDGGGCSNLSYDEEEGRCKEVKVVASTTTTTEISRSGIFSTATKSHHFWATIYEGLKQVVPWRRKNGKKSKDRAGLLP